MSKMMTQVMLSSPMPSTGSFWQLTTWVESDKRLRKGVKVKLKDDDRKWTVDTIYSDQPFSVIDNRGWDNNNYDKHDGTSIKDRVRA